MTQYCPSAWSSTAVPFGVVLAKAHARRDEDAVDLVAHDRNRRHVGDREVVEPAHGRAAESAAGRLDEVVVLGGLVVDGGDPAVRVGAERVLRGRVGVSARIRDRRRDGLDDADVQRLAVRLAQDLVERAVVGGVQRARGAVGGHAGVAGGGVDVTRALRPGGGALRPAPACCAIVNVAPISVSASASMSTRLILVFMCAPEPLTISRVHSRGIRDDFDGRITVTWLGSLTGPSGILTGGRRVRQEGLSRRLAGHLGVSSTRRLKVTGSTISQ